MSRMYYKKVSPLGSISPSLPSQLIYEFESGKNDLYHMKDGKSFFLPKTDLNVGGNKVASNENFRRTWNFCSALFTTAREKWNGKLVTTVNDFPQADSAQKRNFFSKQYLDTIGAYMSLDSDTSRLAESRAFKIVDGVYVPYNLKCFQTDIKGGTKVRLEFDFVNNIKQAVEGTTGNRTDSFNFSLSSIDLYILVEENAESVQSGTVLYSGLKEYTCEIIPVNSSVVNHTFKVQPSVKNIYYALQDNDVKTDITKSITKFTSSAQNAITNHYIKYNSQNYPENQMPTVVNSDEETGVKLASYMNLINNGLIDNVAGSEGLENYKAYGKFFLHEIEKDVSVIQTSADIQIQFSSSQTCSLCIFTVHTVDLATTYDTNGNVIDVLVEIK